MPEALNLLKMTLIERLGRSFDALLKREFGKRFYTPEFLNEIVEKKATVDAEMAKNAGATFLSASIITFFDLISGKVSLGSGLTVEFSKDLSPILSFITASLLLKTVMLFLDLQVINQVMIRLGQNINVNQFNIIFINKKSPGNWSDALTPSYFGEKSGKTHHYVFNFLSIIMLIFGLVMIAYPSAAIISSFLDIYNSNTRMLGKFVSYASVFMLFLIYTLIACFAVRYQFLPADFDEATYEPTEHFKKEMEKRIADEVPVQPPASGI